jgi:hypothetical protein
VGGGKTASQEAAFRCDAELVRTLLDLGADRTLQDTDHRATPVGWAEHAAGEGQDRTAVIELLR